MFGKLKEKLKNFKDSVTDRIHEKGADEALPDTPSLPEKQESGAVVPETAAETTTEDQAETKSAVGTVTETDVGNDAEPVTGTDDGSVAESVSGTSSGAESAAVTSSGAASSEETATEKNDVGEDAPKTGTENGSGQPSKKSFFSRLFGSGEKKESKQEKPAGSAGSDVSPASGTSSGTSAEKSSGESESRDVMTSSVSEKSESDSASSSAASASSSAASASSSAASASSASVASTGSSASAVSPESAKHASAVSGIVPDTPAESRKKEGFFSRAKSFVLKQEVVLDDKDLEEPLEELEFALLESDLALEVCEDIIDSVRKELAGTHKKIGKSTDAIVEDALRNAILKVMSHNVFDFDEYIAARKGQTTHLAFIGINGTGKTTSIAKIAYRLRQQGYSVAIAAGDTYRAGAIDQIRIHADRLGIKLISHQEGSDPAAVIYDALQYSKAHNIDVLLSDTAGRMHTNVNLMAQLEKICRVSSPDLIIFVDESTAGNDAVRRASQFSEAVRIDGTILTKLDADSKGGAAISIAGITKSPILFFGVGQEYGDLQKFDPEWFVNTLFEDDDDE